jgi:hypothetical protein
MNLEQCIKAAVQIDSDHLNPGWPVERSDDGRGVPHLRWMLKQIISSPEMSQDKAMRWLGYVQGALVTTGQTTLEQMKEVSRRAVHR